MNFNAGASSTADVDAAFNAATTVFNTYTPAQVKKLPNNERQAIISYANTLDSYNNGDIGPGHCDENESFVSNNTDDETTDNSAQDRDNILTSSIEVVEMTLSPNPARSFVRITIPATDTAAELYIMDSAGSIVLHNQIPAGQANFDVQLGNGSISAGTYYVRVQSGTTVSTAKLIVIN